MKKINKIIAISLIFLIIFTFGCNNNGNNNVLNNENNNSEVTNNINDGDDENISKTKGFMWKVKDKDIYFFGSIHVAKPEMYPFVESVEDAFKASEILAIEADVNSIDPQMMADMVTYKGEDNVFNHLTEEGKKKLEEISKELNMDLNLISKFNVWSVGSTLSTLQLMKSGYDPNSGVEQHFILNSGDKEIAELEGGLAQIEIMNSLTDKEQEELFVLSLESNEKNKENFEELYNLYIKSDVDEMTKYLFEEMNEQNEVEKKLLYDRNINMAKTIEEEFINADKKAFIVVGLAHYLGEGSIIDLLREKGYEINLVE